MLMLTYQRYLSGRFSCVNLGILKVISHDGLKVLTLTSNVTRYLFLAEKDVRATFWRLQDKLCA